MLMRFEKYSGCGNDFILIDNRHLRLIPSISAIKNICHRQQGIGADGLIFLENSKVLEIPYRMRIFNADGSEAEMCGNGLRCLAHFIRSTENTLHPFIIETMHQRIKVSFDQNLVSATLPSPKPISSKMLSIDNHDMLWYCLDTGVPHAVHFVDHIDDNDQLLLIAPAIRFHKEFYPKGTNVNFAQILPDHSISIRTYERGIERETLACGTGAVAVAIASSHAYQLKSPVKIHTRSRSSLTIHFKKNASNFTDLVMTGPVLKIFEGLIDSEMFGF